MGRIQPPSPARDEMTAPAKNGKSGADYRRHELLSCLSRSSHASHSKPGQVVTLASLSRRIPDGLVAESLAQLVKQASGAPVLLLRVIPGEATLALGDCPAVLAQHREGFYFGTHLQGPVGGVDLLALHVGDAPLERNHIASLLSHCSRHFQNVIVQMDAEVSPRLVGEFLNRAELPYVLFHQNTDCFYRFSVLLREMRAQGKGTGLPVQPILCLDEDELARSGVDFANQLGCPVHATLHALPGRSSTSDAGTSGNGAFNRGLRQLAREIGHSRIGLALSSGAAKGLAHVGVIQVLEENGVEVDMIAGCSMGSYVGALWAHGHDGKFLEEKARELQGRFGLWKLIDPVLPPRQGFLRGVSVKNRLKQSIGDSHFADLARPLRVVATNFDTLERVVFANGEVAAAVHASSAIPGVCVPVEIDGETYMDGGISDPLPVDVLKEAGIERIIAVNTIPTPAYLRCSREMEREQATVKSSRYNLLKFINQQVNYFARGNILDIMQSSILGAQIRNAEEACRQAHVVLRPLACDGSWHDFTHPEKYIALGRRVTEEHLDEIKALLRRKEPAHENEPAHVSLAAAA